MTSNTHKDLLHMFKSKASFHGSVMKNPALDHPYLGITTARPARPPFNSTYHPMVNFDGRPHVFPDVIKVRSNQIDERHLASLEAARADLHYLKSAGAPGFRSMTDFPKITIKSSHEF